MNVVQKFLLNIAQLPPSLSYLSVKTSCVYEPFTQTLFPLCIHGIEESGDCECSHSYCANSSQDSSLPGWGYIAALKLPDGLVCIFPSLYAYLLPRSLCSHFFEESGR